MNRPTATLIFKIDFLAKPLGIVFIFILIGLLPISTSAQDDPVEILFLGSSYFNRYDMPTMFANLAANAGKDLYYDQYIPSGLYLANHANSSITEALINERDWDFVILQGVGSITAYPDYYTGHPVYPALVTLQNIISANCPETIMVFCMPWAYEDGMTWVPGWTDTFADMQLHIYNNTLGYLDNLEFTISPVGWSWLTVLEEMDYPLHYLHQSDWNHPSRMGSYLMACTIYTTVFQESSESNPYWGEIDEETAVYFQSVAATTVLDSLVLWNIMPSEIGNGQPGLPDQIKLYPNYPNPFNPGTTIEYELPESSELSLHVFDIRGARIRTLKNGRQAAGSHTVQWDSRDDSGKLVGSGMYFAKLQSGRSSQTIKLVFLN